MKRANADHFEASAINLVSTQQTSTTSSPENSAPEKQAHARVATPQNGAAQNGVALASIGFLRHRVSDRIKGRYEVLAHLGGGNFGSVYRVRDEAVGTILACKEMHVLNNPSTQHDERAQALDPFKREALNLATLRHPHIPAAYFEQEDGDWSVCPRCGLDFSGAKFCPDHGTPLLSINQRYYLMMDFIDGPTLEEMAVENRAPLGEDECIEWIAQIGSALRSLHIVGIVHRDVKPDNIKIRRTDNQAFLLDFGLTKKAEEAGAYGTLRISGTNRFGTPGYAPPARDEQERPEPRSDIYALGMTLLRLLTMRDPQEPAQLQELSEKKPRDLNQRISPEVENIICKATARDKARRYESIEAMLTDLNALRSGVSTHHAPPFTFSDGARARTPMELARQIEAHGDEATNYLFNGMFAGWLRQSGFAAPARAAEDLVKSHDKQPRRALELLRRALYPANSAARAVPKIAVEPGTLSFGNLPSGATSTQKLRIRNVGAGFLWGKILIDGDLPGLKAPREWENNVAEIEITLDTTVASVGAYAGAIILQSEDDLVRVPVDYIVSALSLKVEPPELDFGAILVGKKKTQTIRVLRTEETDDGGTPRGTIYAGESLGGMVTPSRFFGESEIEITADGAMPDALAKPYSSALQLDTNGGRLRVPVRYSFVLPPARWLGFVLREAALGALGAAALRLLYAVISLEFVFEWLAQNRGIVSLAFTEMRIPILVGAICGAFYSVWWTARAWDEKRLKTFQFQFFVQTLTLCVLLGAVLFWPLAWLLHWMVWGLGDWILRPFFALFGLHNALPAPAAWAVVGGIGGALHGLARGFAARGQTTLRYGIYGFYVVAFFVLLIHAMLS